MVIKRKKRIAILLIVKKKKYSGDWGFGLLE